MPSVSIPDLVGLGVRGDKGFPLLPRIPIVSIPDLVGLGVRGVALGRMIRRGLAGRFPSTPPKKLLKIQPGPPRWV